MADTYTIEIRTAIGTADHKTHAWIYITHPDGKEDAWGLYPKSDNLGNIIYGEGRILPDYSDFGLIFVNDMK